MTYKKKSIQCIYMSKRKTASNRILERDYKKGMTIVEMGKKYGCSPQAVHYALKRVGISTRQEKQVGLTGDKHPQWKGGIVIKNGYPMKYMPEHKRRYKIPYVPMHVLEVEKKIGRTPLKTEPIHHIDLDRSNYDIKNLFLCKNGSEHAQIHASLERIIGELIKKGVIEFKNGKYAFNVDVVAHILSFIPKTK